MTIHLFATYCALLGLQGDAKESRDSFYYYMKSFNECAFRNFTAFSHIVAADRSPYRYVVRLSKHDVLNPSITGDFFTSKIQSHEKV